MKGAWGVCGGGGLAKEGKNVSLRGSIKGICRFRIAKGNRI